MATGVGAKKPCCKCNKGGATFTCEGCRQSFCLKHVSDHRQELAQQMDDIGQQHDVLQRDMGEQSINRTLLTQIDLWEEQSIEKIRSSANEARTDLKRLTEESKTRLSTLMSKLSNELRSNREGDEYTEHDLDGWMNQLKELRHELERPSEIEIAENTQSTFCLIKIKKINTHESGSIDLSEKFSEQIGPVILSKDGCFATHVSDCDSDFKFPRYSSVCGSIQYSSDIYQLRFQIKTHNSSSVFFGIIKSSQRVVDKSTALNSVYGFWSDGMCVRAGKTSTFYENTQTQPNDEVLLIIDCSSSKISYIHDRTQKRGEIQVDQKICPLPWKFVVTLYYPNDGIKILN